MPPNSASSPAPRRRGRAAALVPWLASLCFALPAFAAEQVKTVESQAGTLVVENLASGLDHPWGMVFLPDGRLLVTERLGQLRILGPDGTLSPPLEGTPEVVPVGQGGLLDVALDPEFATNRLVYLSYAEPGDGGASTALGRGRLAEDRLEEFTVIFRQQPKVSGPNHFGGRIVFAPDGQHLFLVLGERFEFEPAQDLSDHMGTIVRIRPDGSVPEDNPFVGQEGARPEIWSYGHRNIEAAAISPTDGALWVAEMGPAGGDELNQPAASENHGWPVVSWGQHYDGRDIPDPPTEPRFADASLHWTPVIAPSGMIFYSGEAFPAWKGSGLIGGLTALGVVRVEIDGREAREVERVGLGARIRDVEQAPDGSIYLLTDESDGNVWRLAPADAE